MFTIRKQNKSGMREVNDTDKYHEHKFSNKMFHKNNKSKISPTDQNQ